MASGSCVLRGTPGKARASVEGLNPVSIMSRYTMCNKFLLHNSNDNAEVCGSNMLSEIGVYDGIHLPVCLAVKHRVL